MLKKCNETMSCDAVDCMNKASHFFKIKGGMKTVCLCEQCMKNLFDDLSGVFVPKSPKNKISDVMDKKKGALKGDR